MRRKEFLVKNIYDVYRDEINQHDTLLYSNNEPDNEMSNDDKEVIKLALSISKQQALEELNSSLQSIAESPFKFQD